MTADPNAPLTLAVAALMITLGLRRGGLDLRREREWCGACGRRLEAGRCKRCTP